MNHARILIDDFLADYAHTIDDGQLEDWPAFFTQDVAQVPAALIRP